MNRITLREEIETQKADASQHLKALKAKMAQRSGEFVSKRIDSRTIVVARPSHIENLINEINKD